MSNNNMELPSFDNPSNLSKPKRGSESQKKDLMSNQQLPSFDDLVDEFDSTDWATPPTRSNRNLSNDDTMPPKLPSFDEHFNSEVEDNSDEVGDEENFEHVERDEQDGGDFSDTIEDDSEEVLDNEENRDDHDNVDSHYDEEGEGEDDFEDEEWEFDEGNFEDVAMESLLPGMEPDNSQKESKTKVKSKEDLKGENQEVDADEKAKEFFMNLKEKVMSLFSKKPKDKNKPKSRKLTKNKIDKSKDNPKPKRKSPPKEKKKINKKDLIKVGIVVIPIIALITLYFLWQSSHSLIEELEMSVKFKDESSGEKLSVHLKDFEINEDEIEITIANESDISISFSAYVTLKESSPIPFAGAEVNCESDIVNVETEGELREILTCNGELSNDLKYKLDAEIDSF